MEIWNKHELEKQRWSCEVDSPTAEKYKQYFKENDIYFEASECYDLVHISFLITEAEMQELDKWIREVLFKSGKGVVNNV